MFLGVYWNQPVCLFMCPSIHECLCVQDETFCHSVGKGIKSHSVTALVFIVFKVFELYHVTKFWTCPNLQQYLVGDKSNLAELEKIMFEWFENFIGKGENAGYQHFLLFKQCFKKLSVWRGLSPWNTYNNNRYFCSQYESRLFCSKHAC